MTAVPSLRPFLYEAARSVPDPKGRGTVYDVWRAADEGNVRGYGIVAGARTDDPAVRILGSGSDYTVFFNHIGVPSVDAIFDGPYGVYHSIYDTHEWVRRFGDPGFDYGPTFWSYGICSAGNPVGCPPGDEEQMMSARGLPSRSGTSHAALGGPASDA